MSAESVESPPAHPADARGDATRLRHATADDLPALAELERRCFGREAWDARALARELAEPHALVLLAPDPQAPGEAAGYVSLRRVEDEGELLRIAVVPGRQRRGGARRLLAAGLDALRRAGAARCTLEVRADNAVALALYRHAGFRELHRRRAYYRDGCDALILARQLGALA